MDCRAFHQTAIIRTRIHVSCLKFSCSRYTGARHEASRRDAVAPRDLYGGRCAAEGAGADNRADRPVAIGAVYQALCPGTTERRVARLCREIHLRHAVLFLLRLSLRRILRLRKLLRLRLILLPSDLLSVRRVLSVLL